MAVIKQIQEVTNRIIIRSLESRNNYLEKINANHVKFTKRSVLSCGNLAHGFAGCNAVDKEKLAETVTPNIGLVTAYNDMLSAHKTYEDYPKELRQYANQYNATLQVAGATPAMCDGVTQGQSGMELSLLSRDVIALSTAVALSHDMFDGSANLGICDKIVPGLLIGNLSFGHLPSIFIPGGPMESGITNEEKAKMREEFAAGKISREELLKGESDSYHSPGTCTFYGTANSNQMLMEIMGLQLPGSSFVNPNTPLRKALNEYSIQTLIKNIESRDITKSLGHLINEKTIVNGIIGLLATGGSTNHTLHLPAIAKAAGIKLTWEDFADLSEVVPLIAKVYPNGAADINHFHASGGMQFVIHTLLANGLLHQEVQTVIGRGLNHYTKEPKLIKGKIQYVEGPKNSLNQSIIRKVGQPFQSNGGLKVLNGNVGKAVIKTSAIDESKYIVKAEAIVFYEQEDLINAYKNGELDKDFIAVLPFQGPSQRGMPELHKLTPTLTILQKKGFHVGIITDGRMSGASGKVPSAIHVTPEAAKGGNIGKIKTGDLMEINALTGTLNCLAKEMTERQIAQKEESNLSHGRELFNNLRTLLSGAEDGASFLNL